MIPSLLPIVDPIARTGEFALDDEPARDDVIVPPSFRPAVPALPLPAPARRSVPPDAAFDRDVQSALGRRARETSSDADEVLSGHRGPITAGD